MPELHHNAIDFSGMRFGRLIVLEYIGKGPTKLGTYWRCICDCGKEHQAYGADLNAGWVKSCGCLHAEGNQWTHRGSKTREYKSWCHMRARCMNPSDRKYKDYGGRGISIDPSWDDFSVFLAHMGPRPNGTSIDRIDNEGNYRPGNCRWATPKQQANNKRNTRI